jgi:hypothetical protein
VAPTAKPRGRRKSQNVSQVAIRLPNGQVITDERDYSQAIPMGNAPAPQRMPSVQETNAIHATQAARREMNMNTRSGDILNVALTKALASAAKLPDTE